MKPNVTTKTRKGVTLTIDRSPRPEEADRIRREAAEASWPMRVLRHTRANTTSLGTALLAMVRPGINAKGPSYGPNAAVDLHGQLWTQWVRDPHAEPEMLNLGPVIDLDVSLEVLANELKLKDDERAALKDMARKWIAYDARAIADVKL